MDMEQMQSLGVAVQRGHQCRIVQIRKHDHAETCIHGNTS